MHAQLVVQPYIPVLLRSYSSLDVVVVGCVHSFEGSLSQATDEDAHTVSTHKVTPTYWLPVNWSDM